MHPIRWLLDRAIGVPTQPSGYRPSMSGGYSITNVGAAYWSVEERDGTLRVFARRFPPISVILTASLVSAIAVGLLAAVIIATAGTDRQRIAIGIGGLAITLALGGIWIGALLGNWQQSHEPELLRIDFNSGSIEFPRFRALVQRSDVLRIELVTYCVESDKDLYDHHLVLAHRAPDSTEAYQLLLEKGAPMKRLGERLASRLNIPFALTSAGHYNMRKKAWYTP